MSNLAVFFVSAALRQERSYLYLAQGGGERAREVGLVEPPLFAIIQTEGGSE